MLSQFWHGSNTKRVRLVVTALLVVCVLGIMVSTNRSVANSTRFTIEPVNSPSTGGSNAPVAPMPKPESQPGMVTGAREDFAADGSVQSPPAVKGGPVTNAAASNVDRKVIKEGSLALEVTDISATLERLNALASGSGGYVLQSQTSYGGYGYEDTKISSASTTIIVPADRFESTLNDTRRLGSRLLSEQSNGQDVTDEYVDTESQIKSLEATLQRVRAFLDRAQNVDEALAVNAQMTQLETQLDTLKGRRQYLQQRTNFSTINIALQLPPSKPVIPDTRPFFLPEWNPGETIRQAYSSLLVNLYGLGDMVIWFGIVILPFALPLLGIFFLLRWALKSRKPKAIRPSEQPSL